MKRELIKIVFSLITVLTLVCFVEYKNTDMHETIHSNIYDAYGYESVIEVNIFGGTTTAYNITHSDMLEMESMHNMNDVVGYHSVSIRFILYAILLVLLIKYMYI